MAQEITLTAAIKFEKLGALFRIDVNGLRIDVAGKKAYHNTQTVGTSQEALMLPDFAVGGWFIGVNRDTVNFIEMRQATGASDFARMRAGEPAMFRFSPDMTAPFVIADTASCDLEYLIIEV